MDLIEKDLPSTSVKWQAVLPYLDFKPLNKGSRLKITSVDKLVKFLQKFGLIFIKYFAIYD